MTFFLSPSWLDQITAAAGGDMVGPGATVVQHVVTGGPDGDVAFVLDIQNGHLRARPGHDPTAVVTVTQSWETAELLHRGELTPPDAFRRGLVKLRGDVSRLVEVVATIGPLGPALQALREHPVDV